MYNLFIIIIQFHELPEAKYFEIALILSIILLILYTKRPAVWKGILMFAVEVISMICSIVLLFEPREPDRFFGNLPNVIYVCFYPFVAFVFIGNDLYICPKCSFGSNGTITLYPKWVFKSFKLIFKN